MLCGAHGQGGGGVDGGLPAVAALAGLRDGIVQRGGHVSLGRDQVGPGSCDLTDRADFRGVGNQPGEVVFVVGVTVVDRQAG